tara:strand:+ start:223 stop:471 length:249 start_codon:yes stop_codon:yes gene_type:complete
MYGFLFFVLVFLLSQTASSDKTENQIQEVIVEESISYSIEARETEEPPIMIMEHYDRPPQDRMCDSLDEIIEILKEDGVESK